MNAADGESKKKGLTQGSIVAPTLFNIYTNDQPIHNRTMSFIYADDQCITAQYQSFYQVEKTIEEALNNMTAFHLGNKEAKRSLKVVDWKETELENITHLKYLGVTLYRALIYKQHIQSTKMKVATHNNLLMKCATSRWGANPSTIRTSALA